MVLVVALVSGMTALVCALVVPTWVFAALVVARSEPARDADAPLLPAPFLFSTGLRAPPPA
jgi:hypothetical protein